MLRTEGSDGMRWMQRLMDAAAQIVLRTSLAECPDDWTSRIFSIATGSCSMAETSAFAGLTDNHNHARFGASRKLRRRATVRDRAQSQILHVYLLAPRQKAKTLVRQKHFCPSAL